MSTRLLTILAVIALAACGKGEDSAPPAPASGAQETAQATVEKAVDQVAETAGQAADQAAETAEAAAGAARETMAQAQAAAATAGADLATGEAVYKKTCMACHAMGVAGAPKLGDSADWEPRIAQGMDVLYDHSINGYTGKKGMMPPKGGNLSLSDEDTRAAVDYMVSQAQ